MNPAQDIVDLFKIHRTLKEMKLYETLHLFEQETGLFLDLNHVRVLGIAGKWSEMEKYLLGFTSAEDDKASRSMFFAIRKGKYFDSLERGNILESRQLLLNEVLPIAEESTVNELSLLLAEETFEPTESRKGLLESVIALIKSNSCFQQKLDESPLASTTQIQPQGIPPTPQAPKISSACHRMILHHLNLNPKDVRTTDIVSLEQEGHITSMDFNPYHQDIIIVGTDLGMVTLWEISSKKKLASAMLSDSVVSINRVLWDGPGTSCGVAFSKHIVQMYSCVEGKRKRPSTLISALQIKAHEGEVRDLAFTGPLTNDKFYFVTCGDDGLVKVWDFGSGELRHTFAGHATGICSLQLAPGNKPTFKIFSASTDGMLNIWKYEENNPQLLSKVMIHDCKASDQNPGYRCHIAVGLGADGRRIFTCTTDPQGNLELTERGARMVRQRFSVSQKKKYSGERHHLDINNQYLAVGHESKVKIWSTDPLGELLFSTDVGKQLQEQPCVRFNKLGTQLAVAGHTSLKILAADCFGRLPQTDASDEEPPRLPQTDASDEEPPRSKRRRMESRGG